MWQNHKESMIWMIASVCAMLVLSGVAIFLYRSIKNESAQIKGAENAIAALDGKERDLANTKTALQELRSEIDGLDHAFLSDERFVGFLKLLESLAGEAHVVFEASRADLPRSADGNAGLSFGVRGEYASIVRFFSLLDHVKYAGVVDQVLITPESAKGNALIVRGHYAVFNFTQPQ